MDRMDRLNKEKGSSSSYFPEVFDVSDHYYGSDDMLGAFGNCASEPWGFDGLDMCDYDDEFIEPKKRERVKGKPKLTREQEQRIVSYLKRKKCVQVTQKLRDSIFKKFDVSLTDKGIRDLMKRNNIYKRGK